MNIGNLSIGIVGSRTFNNYEALKKFIFQHIEVDQIYQVVSGGARGADNLAEKFAQDYVFKLIVFNPEWDQHGKKAGYIRNKDIVKNSDIIFAFWDGKSKGTAHTIDYAEECNVVTHVYVF